MHELNLSLVKTEMRTLMVKERLSCFDEVEKGYTAEQAALEASRCLNCPGRYCAAACPVNTPVPEFIGHIREGDLASAYEFIAKFNPMPQFSCRVCAHERQCEENCTRAIKGQATAIGALERFVSDWRVNNPSRLISSDKNGWRVAIAGSGPAGLACARELAKRGFAVEIFEAKPYPGGILAWGIPAFKLPKNVLPEYLEELSSLGVVIHCNTPVGESLPISALLGERGFNAVFAAVGCGKEKRLQIDGESLPNVYTSGQFLEAANRFPVAIRQLGHRRVAVVGGGDTAIDVCRAALRLGAEKVILLYRRTREEMPACRSEIGRAEEEGVEIMELTAPTRVCGNGKAEVLQCIRMRSTMPNYPGGRTNSAPLGGSEFIIEADAVVSALGFEPAHFLGIEQDERGYLQVGKDGVSTAFEGVFAGGDATGGRKAVIVAAGSGKKAALAVESYCNSKVGIRK
jgi:glutamate synthase (NADPH/NADH) small chain